LKSLLPQARFQKKGLLATEAPLSVPITGFSRQLPLLQEVFYELEDSHGNVWPLWEARAEQVYELILSQKSGLLRYRLGDRVRLFREDGRCFLEFTGRHQVSDLAGEKLHEEFLHEAMLPVGPQFGNYIFLPQVRESRYVLLCERSAAASSLNERAAEVERRLRTNPHYALARDLEQLQPVRIEVWPEFPQAYQDFFISRGMKWGDIKPRVLLTDPEQSHDFLMMVHREQELARTAKRQPAMRGGEIIHEHEITPS
jgi:hypothetical protein